MTPGQVFASVLAAILTAAIIIASVYYLGWELPERKRKEAYELYQMQEKHRKDQAEIDKKLSHY